MRAERRHAARFADLGEYFYKAGMFKLFSSALPVGLLGGAGSLWVKTGSWIVGALTIVAIVIFSGKKIYDFLKFKSLNYAIACVDCRAAIVRILSEPHEIPCEIALEGLFGRVSARTGWNIGTKGADHEIVV